MGHAGYIHQTWPLSVDNCNKWYVYTKNTCTLRIDIADFNFAAQCHATWLYGAMQATLGLQAFIILLYQWESLQMYIWTLAAGSADCLCMPVLTMPAGDTDSMSEGCDTILVSGKH